MRQGFTTAQTNALRTRPQGAEWYLAVHKPRVAGTFSIISPQLSGSVVAEVDVAQVGSLATSPLAGMTGIVLDGADNFIGDFRLRKNWSFGTLAVAESGSGLINWKQGATIKILDQFRPWIKHPRYDGSASQWRMDFDIAYDGQLNRWGPYANLGPPIVALPTSWVFDSEGISSSPIWIVNFWSDSISIQSFVQSGSWVFPDGQTVTSSMGTSATPIEMTFTGASPGGSYFTFACEDEFGTSHMGRRLIFALEDISQFPAVLTSTITGGIGQGGYQARFLASLGAGFATNQAGIRLDSSYPWLENTEFVVFERAHYGASQMSIGGNYGHRESTLFRGWTKSADIRVGPFSSDMTILAETVNGIIGESDSYDIFLANYQAGGSDWTEMQGLCIDGVAQYALKWRSTLGNICDWQPMGLLGTTETILYQALPRAPFWEQLRQNYNEKGVLGHIASDMQSNLHAFQDVNISGLSALLPQTTLASGDTRDDIVINTVPRDANAQVSLHAVGNLNVPYIAESPAHVRGYFGGERVFEKGLLVDGQDRLITWTGNYRAKLNSKYPIVNVPLAGNTRIDPIPQSIVSLSLSGSENARGVNWVNKKFLPKDLNVTYDANAGYPLYDINMEELVNGIGGSSVNLPAIDEIVPIPTNPPPSTVIPVPSVPPTPIGFGTGFGTVYVMTVAKLGRTRDFSAATPSWTDITPPASPGHFDFILDPWNPASVGFLMTPNGIYRSKDLTSASPTWELIFNAATIISELGFATFGNGFGKVVGSINVDGYLAIFWLGNGYTLYCSTTTNNKGASVSWNHSLVAETCGARSWCGGGDVLQHVVNDSLMLYAVYVRNVSFSCINNAISVARSTDGGISWTQVGDILASAYNNKDTYSLNLPYKDNESGNKIYVQVYTDVADTRGVWISSDGGSSWTQAYSGGLSQVTRYGAESYTLDSQKGYFVTGYLSPSSLFTTDDGFATYSEATMTGVAGTIMATGGFPTASSQFYLVTNTAIGNNGIYVSTDRGESWSNKTGNWKSVMGVEINTALAPTDTRAVIVPLWTE